MNSEEEIVTAGLHRTLPLSHLACVDSDSPGLMHCSKCEGLMGGAHWVGLLFKKWCEHYDSTKCWKDSAIHVSDCWGGGKAEDNFYCHRYLSLVNSLWENAPASMRIGSDSAKCHWLCGRGLWLPDPIVPVDLLEEKQFLSLLKISLALCSESSELSNREPGGF